MREVRGEEEEKNFAPSKCLATQFGQKTVDNDSEMYEPWVLLNIKTFVQFSKAP